MGANKETEKQKLLSSSLSLSYSSTSINDGFSSSTSGIVITESWIKESGTQFTRTSGCEDSIAFSGRQKLMIACIILANCCLGTNYSLLGPFFPKQAEKKGYTPTQYCFIFGIFQLVTFLVSLVIGKLIPPLTPRFCLISGAFLNGSCAILFGLLHWCPADARFYIVAVVVQTLQAVGCGAVFTASYTLVSTEFPDKASFFFSTVEASYGMGQVFGPIIGGPLHQVGGFFLPYTVTGTFTVLISIILIFIFPKTEISKGKHDHSMLKLMMNLSFCIDMLIIIMAFMLMCFLDATLEPHIRRFHLPPSLLGLIFPITGALYALTAPLWGFICGKLNNPRKACLLGCCFCGISFLLIGPSPLIPQLKTKLWLVILGQLCLGSGSGSSVVGSFAHCTKQAILRGFPDDISTYAIVSGATSAAVALGSFIGPTIGGLLVEAVSFQGATLILLAVVASVTATLIGHMIYENRQERKRILFRPRKSNSNV